jgi:hypothetical protein
MVRDMVAQMTDEQLGLRLRQLCPLDSLDAATERQTICQEQARRWAAMLAAVQRLQEARHERAV